ncbi:FxLYD domain-containing protein [Paenibacillus paridis]|uniref:FxLYD domain-containing protein n=1 Tax=Paenibacillus paridis TaxID=2583376 RepID=UPI00112297C4|nr:FxLYD domain-containing protein [Paenibacillus paridis]
MYCHHCGKKRTDDAIYCSQCGRRLSADQDAETAAQAEHAAAIKEAGAAMEIGLESLPSIIPTTTRRKAARGSVWAWLIPIMLTLLTAASVFCYYIYQTGINDRVIRLQGKAREEALAGNYTGAKALLKEASDARPGFAAIQKDAEIVDHVDEISLNVAAAGKRLEERNLAEAEQLLEQAKEELKGHTEPIYDKMKVQLGELMMKLGVMKLTDELADLNSVDELAAKLNAANHLEGEEAAAVKEQIVAKIVEISYKEAETLMKNKSYTAALEITGKALSLAKDNEKLLKLEKQINQAQIDFEQAEQQRLEHAMQQAAAEDLKNQTAAVEVVKIDSTLDEFGDLNMEAELKNAATRPIYSITVKFTVFDAAGHEIGTGTAQDKEAYVQPGETLRMTSTVYGVNDENTTIVVDHATWYLD